MRSKLVPQAIESHPSGIMDRKTDDSKIGHEQILNSPRWPTTECYDLHAEGFVRLVGALVRITEGLKRLL
jgi:hypothetical protein